MFGSRNYSFEVLALREGRWTIDTVLDNEEVAIGDARSRLAKGACEEIKVVRVRAMLTGFVTRKEILHETRPNKEKPLVVAAKVDRADLCTELADLYALPSRKLMTRLLRAFLDRYQVTPVEILHNWTWARKLADTGTMIGSSLFQVASAQAQCEGGTVRDRQRAIEQLVDQAMKRLRDFQADRRRLPPFEIQDLNRASHRIRAHVAPEDHDFTFLAQLSLHLVGTSSIPGKMEVALGLMRDDLDPHLGTLIEGIVADGLGAAETVKELLGAHPNLGSSLIALATFLQGKGGASTPMLTRIGTLIEAGRAPSCREILVERLIAEVGRDANPLDRKAPDEELAMIEKLGAALTTADGTMLGGAATEAALARRRVRHRQEMLRRIGLHDAADALGSELRRLSV